MTESNTNPSNNIKHAFPLDILSDPPPSQNPLIGSLHADTLANLRDCLVVLGDLSLYEDTMLTDGATVGFYHLMTCVRDALVFEISHRDQIEAEQKVERLLKTTETQLKYHHRKHEKRQAEAGKILGIDDESGEPPDT